MLFVEGVSFFFVMCVEPIFACSPFLRSHARCNQPANPTASPLLDQSIPEHEQDVEHVTFQTAGHGYDEAVSELISPHFL